MATFDISGLSRGSGGGSGAGLLADQLQILENSLAGNDGILSPGDYDLLIAQARKLSTSPGLSAAQRSNYLVKISEYEKNKASAGFKKKSDLEYMNKALLNEQQEDVIAAGNNPQLYLQGRAASIESKLNDLTESIERLETAGEDTSEYVMEFNETLRNYQNVLNAQAAMEAAGGRNDGGPIPGFAAYVTTNDRGEIVDVDYTAFGAKSGYVETNGTINGFQVFGKVNAKQNGKNVFVLGDQRFSAPDFMQPDPTNPGSFKVQRLVAESMQSGDAFKRGEPGFLNLDSGKIQTQSYIPRGSWVKGIDGTLYQRREDGGYTKYLNFTPTDVDPNSIMKIPKILEQSIAGKVDQVSDGAAESLNPNENWHAPMAAPMGQAPLDAKGNVDLGQGASPMGETFNPFQAGPDLGSSPIKVQSSPSSSPGITQRTESPTQRSPQNPAQYAKQTINKAGKFFKDLFS